ncbi:MAG: saccharopine dehydrogenase C-terminal domain-containing protein [Chitinophagaceae bacterium]
MHKHVLLFGAGKSAGFLIDYLKIECQLNNWVFSLVDGNQALAESKLGSGIHLQAIGLDVQNTEKRRILVNQADIVISLLPPALHILLANDCVLLEKNLLTASYLDGSIMKLAPEILRKKLFFLCEMGLDPGIDHMSAMTLIHRIIKSGGHITSFKSHCGGLVAPESDDNCWRYKISWNPRNIVLAGAGGAAYKENNSIINKRYDELFDDCKTITIPELGELAYYPNRDSLAYIPLYGLEEARSFVRTTLRYPAFCTGWNAIVKAGLTDDTKPVSCDGLTYNEWARPILPFIEVENRKQFDFLGFFQDLPVPDKMKTSADILQSLLETKLVMKSIDRDMIVLLHQVVFEENGVERKVESSLIVKGENSVHTAMAKTVGLPLGIAAKLVLQGKISLTGLHIPVITQVYEPIMKELETFGVVFKES